jgi:hypothetical protein
VGPSDCSPTVMSENGATSCGLRHRTADRATPGGRGHRDPGLARWVPHAATALHYRAAMRPPVRTSLLDSLDSGQWTVPYRQLSCLSNTTVPAVANWTVLDIVQIVQSVPSNTAECVKRMQDTISTELMADVRRIEYDCKTATGRVFMAMAPGCLDMTSTILLFQRIARDVCVIETFAGEGGIPAITARLPSNGARSVQTGARGHLQGCHDLVPPPVPPTPVAESGRNSAGCLRRE